MCRLDQLPFTERTDRAAMPVGPEDVDAEPLLVQTHSDLEQDDPLRGVVVSNEDRSDHQILGGSHPFEVDERALKSVRRSKGAVIGLIHAAGAVVVEDHAAVNV